MNLIVRSFLPTRRKTTDSRLDELHKKADILTALTGEKLLQEKIDSVIDLTYRNIEYDCQITGLLLSKFSVSFSLNAINSLITEDIMTEAIEHDKKYDLDFCTEELVNRSFLEKKEDNS